MPNRSAKFVSAIFASILAGAALTTTSHGATVAADDCLSGPKGETPPGRHWYYRIDHPTKRQCWYLREEGDKVSQATPLQIAPQQAIPQKASPSAQPPASQADAAMQRSVADARAELSPQTNRNDGPNTPWPAIAPALNDTPRANAADTNASSTVVASRWPEPSGINSTSSPRPASNLAANVPPNSIAAPAPAVAADTLVTANSSSQSQPGPIPRWFVAVVVPLALGSIVASLIFKFGRSRRPRRSSIRARRRPVWEQTDDDRIVLSDYSDADILPRRPRFSRDLREAG
ncbi:hypothetical protein [Bradyrhizobium sp.]|uniref:hypothetical protein n=1 Tax=Bradyrhizobium sp. TaxID=376 RepID=UPI003C71C5FD